MQSKLQKQLQQAQLLQQPPQPKTQDIQQIYNTRYKDKSAIKNINKQDRFISISQSSFEKHGLKNQIKNYRTNKDGFFLEMSPKCQISMDDLSQLTKYVQPYKEICSCQNKQGQNQHKILDQISQNSNEVYIHTCHQTKPVTSPIHFQNKQQMKQINILAQYLQKPKQKNANKQQRAKSDGKFNKQLFSIQKVKFKKNDTFFCGIGSKQITESFNFVNSISDCFRSKSASMDPNIKHNRFFNKSRCHNINSGKAKDKVYPGCVNNKQIEGFVNRQSLTRKYLKKQLQQKNRIANRRLIPKKDKKIEERDKTNKNPYNTSCIPSVAGCQQTLEDKQAEKNKFWNIELRSLGREVNNYRVDPVAMYQIKNEISIQQFKHQRVVSLDVTPNFSSQYVISHGNIYLKDDRLSKPDEVIINSYQTFASSKGSKVCSSYNIGLDLISHFNIQQQQSEANNNNKTPFISIAHFQKHEQEQQQEKLKSTKKNIENEVKFSIHINENKKEEGQKKVQQKCESQIKQSVMVPQNGMLKNAIPSRKAGIIVESKVNFVNFAELQKNKAVKFKNFIANIKRKKLNVCVWEQKSVRNCRQSSGPCQSDDIKKIIGGQRRVFAGLCTKIEISRQKGTKINQEAEKMCSFQNLVGEVDRRERIRKKTMHLKFQIISDYSFRRESIHGKVHEKQYLLQFSNNFMCFEMEIKMRESINSSKIQYLKQKLLNSCLESNVQDFVKYLHKFIQMLVIVPAKNGCKLAIEKDSSEHHSKKRHKNHHNIKTQTQTAQNNKNNIQQRQKQRRINKYIKNEMYEIGIRYINENGVVDIIQQSKNSLQLRSQQKMCNQKEGQESMEKQIGLSKAYSEVRVSFVEQNCHVFDNQDQCHAIGHNLQQFPQFQQFMTKQHVGFINIFNRFYLCNFTCHFHHPSKFQYASQKGVLVRIQIIHECFNQRPSLPLCEDCEQFGYSTSCLKYSKRQKPEILQNKKNYFINECLRSYIIQQNWSCEELKADILKFLHLEYQTTNNRDNILYQPNNQCSLFQPQKFKQLIKSRYKICLAERIVKIRIFAFSNKQEYQQENIHSGNKDGLVGDKYKDKYKIRVIEYEGYPLKIDRTQFVCLKKQKFCVDFKSTFQRNRLKTQINGEVKKIDVKKSKSGFCQLDSFRSNISYQMINTQFKSSSKKKEKRFRNYFNNEELTLDLLQSCSQREGGTNRQELAKGDENKERGKMVKQLIRQSLQFINSSNKCTTELEQPLNKVEKMSKSKIIRFKNKIRSCKSGVRWNRFYHDGMVENMFCHQFYMMGTYNRVGLLDRGSKNMSFGICQNILDADHDQPQQNLHKNSHNKRYKKQTLIVCSSLQYTLNNQLLLKLIINKIGCSKFYIHRFPFADFKQFGGCCDKLGEECGQDGGYQHIATKIQKLASKLQKYQTQFSYSYLTGPPSYKILYNRTKKLCTGMYIIFSVTYSRKMNFLVVKAYANWIQKGFYFRLQNERIYSKKNGVQILEYHDERYWEDIVEYYLKHMKTIYFKTQVDAIVEKMRLKNLKIYHMILQKNSQNVLLHPAKLRGMPESRSEKSKRKDMASSIKQEIRSIVSQTEERMYENLVQHYFTNQKGQQFLITFSKQFARPNLDSPNKHKKNSKQIFKKPLNDIPIIIQIIQQNKHTRLKYKKQITQKQKNLTLQHHKKHLMIKNNKQTQQSQIIQNRVQKIYKYLLKQLKQCLKYNSAIKMNNLTNNIKQYLQNQQNCYFMEIQKKYILYKKLFNQQSIILETIFNRGVASVESQCLEVGVGDRRREKMNNCGLVGCGGLRANKRVVIVGKGEKRVIQGFVPHAGFLSCVPLSACNLRLAKRIVRFVKHNIAN